MLNAITISVLFFLIVSFCLSVYMISKASNSQF